MEADTAMLRAHGDLEGGLEDASCLQGDRGPRPQTSDLCVGPFCEKRPAPGIAHLALDCPVSKLPVSVGRRNYQHCETSNRHSSQPRSPSPCGGPAGTRGMTRQTRGPRGGLWDGAEHRPLPVSDLSTSPSRFML